ncbi:helix-turn-helix domain-containing protein [Nitrosomonas eutropha]|uniref:helix-turn-helix domain-containing protein n=1 Tax=Nitrosomonas eutropha TaxID=916 RepID=UPI002735EA12|nr:XRE family transcriptional regulator [Nitrosomonas eutropha]
MYVKARLASKISDIICYRHLTQQRAAEILGIPQPKLSGLLRGQFRGISETKMIACLNHLGGRWKLLYEKLHLISCGDRHRLFLQKQLE